jgi:hypothetical protein
MLVLPVDLGAMSTSVLRPARVVYAAYLLPTANKLTLLYFDTDKVILPHSARRKDLSYPKGIEGWAEEWHYFRPTASHPTTQPPDHLSYDWLCLSSQWSDLTQFLNFSSGHHTKDYNCFKWRPTQMGGTSNLKFFTCNIWETSYQILLGFEALALSFKANFVKFSN